MNSVAVRLAAIAVIVITSAFFTGIAEARAPEGAGFSRGGIASHGSFGGRDNTEGSRLENKATWLDPSERSSAGESRLENKFEKKATWADQGKVRNAGESRLENKATWVDEQVAGNVTRDATENTHYYYSLPCMASAVSVDGTNYYNCKGTWYSRGYAGSRVTYVVSNAPPGY